VIPLEIYSAISSVNVLIMRGLNTSQFRICLIIIKDDNYDQLNQTGLALRGTVGIRTDAYFTTVERS
jgi:hypothetical protein